uniref:Uncharacterized protein n=2 Tax=Hemiselmis andersenii TaxID=464988 RepID=A0A6U4MSQ7_HEMAN
MHLEYPVDLISAGRDSTSGDSSMSIEERFAVFGGVSPQSHSPSGEMKGMQAAFLGSLVQFQFNEGECKALGNEFDAFADEGGLSVEKLAALLLERMCVHNVSTTSHAVESSAETDCGGGGGELVRSRRKKAFGDAAQKIACYAFAKRGGAPMDLRSFVKFNEELSSRVQRRAVTERGVSCTRANGCASSKLKRRSTDMAPSPCRYHPQSSQSLELPNGAPMSPSAWIASKLGPKRASLDELEQGEALVAAKRQRRRSIVALKQKKPISPNSASASCELLKSLYKGSPSGPTVRRDSLVSHTTQESSGRDSEASNSATPSAAAPAAGPKARRGSLFNPIKWKDTTVKQGKPSIGRSVWEAQLDMMKGRRKSFGDILATAMPTVVKEQHEVLSRLRASSPATDKASFLVQMLREKMVLD